MTDKEIKEIVQALRCCASGESEGECPFTEKYGCDGCPKVSADLIERLTAENAKAEVERDAALADLADARSCKTCKYACDTRDCSSCKSKTCKCRECHLDKNAWEWRGLPEAPEEIKAPFTEDAMINLAAQALGVEPSRLRELAEADKDGRVVVQPCKVGDKLYRVFAGEIFEHRVGRMKYFEIQGRWDIETYPFCPCVESSIGKTVFFTREEAEKALQEMEGKKDGKT